MCSGVNVPGARTCRVMVPRWTESIHKVARSTEGARCSRFPSATVVMPSTATPTPIKMYLPRFLGGSRLMSIAKRTRPYARKSFGLTGEKHEQFEYVQREEPCHRTCIARRLFSTCYDAASNGARAVRAQIWEPVSYTHLTLPTSD